MAMISGSCAHTNPRTHICNVVQHNARASMTIQAQHTCFYMLAWREVAQMYRFGACCLRYTKTYEPITPRALVSSATKAELQ